MDQWIIIGVIVVVFVGGTVVAKLWWNLAAKVKPYADEKDGASRAPPEEGDVIVIPKFEAGTGAGNGGAKPRSGGAREP